MSNYPDVQHELLLHVFTFLLRRKKIKEKLLHVFLVSGYEDDLSLFLLSSLNILLWIYRKTSAAKRQNKLAGLILPAVGTFSRKVNKSTKDRSWIEIILPQVTYIPMPANVAFLKYQWTCDKQNVLSGLLCHCRVLYENGLMSIASSSLPISSRQVPPLRQGSEAHSSRREKKREVAVIS